MFWLQICCYLICCLKSNILVPWSFAEIFNRRLVFNFWQPAQPRGGSAISIFERGLGQAFSYLARLIPKTSFSPRMIFTAKSCVEKRRSLISLAPSLIRGQNKPKRCANNAVRCIESWKTFVPYFQKRLNWTKFEILEWENFGNDVFLSRTMSLSEPNINVKTTRPISSYL